MGFILQIVEDPPPPTKRIYHLMARSDIFRYYKNYHFQQSYSYAPKIKHYLEQVQKSRCVMLLWGGRYIRNPQNVNDKSIIPSEFSFNFKFLTYFRYRYNVITSFYIILTYNKKYIDVGRNYISGRHEFVKSTL